jgi:hypothetical protein
MNLSTWNNIALGVKKRNPASSPAHVTIEFDRTKRLKICAHKLGRIDFTRGRDLNTERQNVIDENIGNLDLNGFKYKNIGHVYSAPVVSVKSTETDSYEIYAHGHPLGGSEHAGMESCSRMGLACKSGEGADGLCNPGKCVIGKLQRINDNKWKYVSENTYGPENLPLEYYVPAQEKVVLKSVLRGRYITYSPQNQNGAVVAIDKPASIATTIYLPPKFYFSEDFIDSAIITLDDRLRNVARKPLVDIIGVGDRKSAFIQKILIAAYPGTSEGYLSDRLNASATEEIRDTLFDVFSSLQEGWMAECKKIIDEEFLYRFARAYNGLDFISVVYDRIYDLFESLIQVLQSSLSTPKIAYGKEAIARPVYSRLPGTAEAYRSDPAFSDVETPSQWLMSGTDEFLSKKKDSIASFYQDYLDPETCSPQVLDWLAQHVGLVGDLWNPDWNRAIKKTMIRNAFGWWDREINVGNTLTPKGQALSQFPFNKEEWEADPESFNLLSLKLDEIETINVNEDGAITSYSPFKQKIYDGDSETLSVVLEDSVRIDPGLWNGLMEAKGSLLGAAFLSSVLGLKAHTPFELEVVDQDRKILKPRTGLRANEAVAPPLLPYKYDVIQVGSVADAEIENYTNQLVAGVSRVSSVEESRNVFFRVPYYYNRDGRSWDKVSYIAKNWMPSHLNVKVQYAYLSADLWSVGDAFFEPEIITEQEGA